MALAVAAYTAAWQQHLSRGCVDCKQLITDWVPMQNDWVPMTEDGVPRQGRAQVSIGRPAPPKILVINIETERYDIFLLSKPMYMELLA